jgi:hypothetical protein
MFGMAGIFVGDQSRGVAKIPHFGAIQSRKP